MSKSASQSSVSYDASPVRAVDGNTDSVWSSRSCTHTDETTDPWWRGDLGSSQHVSEVFMVNRVKAEFRLFNIEIRVGKLNIPWNIINFISLFHPIYRPHSNQLVTALPQSDKYYDK